MFELSMMSTLKTLPEFLYNKNYFLTPGSCIRVFTGAFIPDSANTIVIQEKVKRKENFIHLESFPKEKQNIREIGSQIKRGSISLEKGHNLNPAGLGLIQSLGIRYLDVYKKPLVTIIVTGNELIPPGGKLSKGKIFESNSLILKAGLEQNQIMPQLVIEVLDSLGATEDTLRKALDSSNLVLISGGISVGDYDFVGKALKNLKVQEIFYKVLQKQISLSERCFSFEFLQKNSDRYAETAVIRGGHPFDIV